MAYLKKIDSFFDSRGALAVIEDFHIFPIKRVYFIYSVPDVERGGHKHIKTKQACVCVNGSCVIDVHNNSIIESFKLDSPTKCLILNPEDWHKMNNFSDDCILLVLASENYDVTDYIDQN